VRLDARLAPDLPQVNGDSDRLQQVFINLINNALDAMPEGGELRVATFTERDESNFASNDDGDGSRVVVDFADTGCGMNEDVRARIFDPLYTTKARGRGTGLGLVVVSQTITDHGGRIEVESERGRGARFRLVFPIATMTDGAAREVEKVAVKH
jgi:signal transduction histidine kinase